MASAIQRMNEAHSAHRHSAVGALPTAKQPSVFLVITESLYFVIPSKYWVLKIRGGNSKQESPAVADKPARRLRSLHGLRKSSGVVSSI